MARDFVGKRLEAALSFCRISSKSGLVVFMSGNVSQVVVADRAECQKGRMALLGRRLLAEVAGDCHAAEATLWLIGPDGKQMLGTLNHGPTPGVLESAAVAVNDSVVGMVASTGISASIGPDEWHNPSVDAATGTKTQAMIAAPVYVKRRLGGVLSAINSTNGQKFAGNDLRTLEWKAYLMGLILGDRNGA